MNSVPNDQKWVFANRDIEIIFINGCDRNNILWIDAFFHKIRNIVALLICILAIFRVLFFYFKQFSVNLNNTNHNIDSIVLDSGRGYGVNNIYNKINVNIDNSIEIESFNIDSFMTYSRVGLFLLLSNVVDSIFCYFKALQIDTSKKVVFLLLKNGLSSISVYSYLRTYFHTFNDNSNYTTYIDAGTLQSHASISAGIRTVCAYHGLIEKVHINCFPEYDSIYVYSKDEKEYLLNLGVDSNIFVYKSTKLKCRNKVVIFYMPLSICDISFSMDRVMVEMDRIINFFNSKSYKIYVKTHPLSILSAKFIKKHKLSLTNWKEKLSDYNVYYLNDSNGINRLGPSFIVGQWGSTTICEALDFGVIPINFSIFTSNKSLFDVYPTDKRSLSWPLDAEIINNILLEGELYDDVINSLYN